MNLFSIKNTLLNNLKLTNTTLNRIYKCCHSLPKTNKFPRRVFSGIQPTGNLHLGNYLGAIRNWAALQHQTDCIYSIVDLHSLTLRKHNANNKPLWNEIHTMTATLLACGIDPQKCILSLQSQVPEHAELCWILQCQITMPRLSQLPQFKEKSSKLKDVPLGIYVYPVLQSADILIYKATEVPIGEDQIQHIQLAKFLASKFNKQFGNIFPYPKERLDSSLAVRIKNLNDPTKKMSKSDEYGKSRIELLDTADTIREKIKKCLTDCISAVTYDPDNRPGVSNLVAIHSLITGKTTEKICSEVEGLETAQYKMIVADQVIEVLRPIRETILDLKAHPDFLQSILKTGNAKAREIASVTIQEVKQAIGIYF